MPYAIAIKEDNYLYKILQVIDEPDTTLEDVNKLRQQYAIVHNIPAWRLILVYSD